MEEPETAAVLVTAPPGTGKSRLAQEFFRSLRRREERVELWIGRGDSLRAGSPLGLLGQALRGALGILGTEPLAEQRERLRTRVEQRVASEDRSRVAEFLGEIVSAPFPDEDSAKLRAARRDAQLMAEQMQQAFDAFLSATCAVNPVVLVFEDLHWGDVSTVRFVDAALRRRRPWPLFVLALARPEVHELFPRIWAEPWRASWPSRRRSMSSTSHTGSRNTSSRRRPCSAGSAMRPSPR
jgi:predicted ATPase